MAYGRADGMRSVECNGGVQPAGWRTRDGALWFPTIMGAVRLDPRRAVTAGPPPPLVIERALVDRREVDPRRAEALPPGRGDLEFHYAALDLGDAHRVITERMDGFEGRLDRRGREPRGVLHEVPPGRYGYRCRCAQRRSLEHAETASSSPAPAIHSTRR